MFRNPIRTENIWAKTSHILFVSSVYFFIYLPMLVLVLFSFNSSSISSEWTGFTLHWYRKLIGSEEVIDSFFNSIIVASSSAVLATTLSLSLVLSSKWIKKNITFDLFYLNMLIPDIVIAVGLLSMFTILRIPLSYMSLIAGHTVISMGFVMPILRSRFMELDPFLTEASLDLGANYLFTFRKIHLPLLLPSIVGAIFIAFTLSLDDFIIAFFCAGPGIQTLPLFIFSKMKNVIDPSLNALSTLMLLIGSLLMLTAAALGISKRVIGNE